MTERRLRQKRGMGLSAQLHVCLVSSMNVSLALSQHEIWRIQRNKRDVDKKFKCCICPNLIICTT